MDSAGDTANHDIVHEGRSYDMREIRRRMDPDLAARVRKETDSDQDFFDAYLIAHANKYGDRFTVR
jgi:hypothetical protein